jgi:murein DD-endopeptidase MepM/ murein hydrolase activator NlpD
MNMIKLLLPVKDVLVTQSFGLNYLDFYKQWGLKGHPGIDLAARRGCKITAAHDGIVSWCGLGKDNGVGVELWNKEQNYKTFYYHHLANAPKVQVGIKFEAGEIIAEADNTGRYTTGDHEHFEIYFVDKQGNTLDRNNGYGGSVDPAPYFAARHGKDWHRPAAYHRYGRNQEWLAEWTMRFKNAWLHRYLIKKGLSPILGIEPINALVYGGWDVEAVINPAMYENWAHLKKTEYLAGKRPFA